jgi:hypothetical protein
METIARLIADPLFDQVQSLLKEGDIHLNKELLLVARHMGVASGFGNFKDLVFGYLYDSHDSIDGNSRYLDPHARVDSEDDSDSLDGF